MKRIVLSGLGIALLLAVVGCGDSGDLTGAPKGDLKPTFTPDPNIVSPSGKFGTGAAKAAATKSEQAAKSAPAEAPAEPK